MSHHHHHHHVDAKTISKELQTVKSAMGFLSEADSFIRLNFIAAVRGFPTPFLISAANDLITQAGVTLSALPNGSALALALNVSISEDFTPGGVSVGTAVTVVNALNSVLGLRAGSLFEFSNGTTLLNAGATAAAKHQDHQIVNQLAVNWNQPVNLAAVETSNVLGDFLHYRAAGFSQVAAIGATINDIQLNHVI
jgi:hypothetical protein